MSCSTSWLHSSTVVERVLPIVTAIGTHPDHDIQSVPELQRLTESTRAGARVIDRELRFATPAKDAQQPTRSRPVPGAHRVVRPHRSCRTLSVLPALR